MMPNATRIMASWGDTLSKIETTAARLRKLELLDKNGSMIIAQDLPVDYEGYPALYLNRSRTQRFMYEYAVSIGIRFHFGCQITEFFEGDGEAGIIVNGSKVTADAVIAADGVHTK